MSQTAAPPKSEPPRPSLIPGRGSNPLPFIAGVIVLGGLTLALLFWPESPPAESKPVVAAPTATASATAETTADFAPPPPPEKEEEEEEKKVVVNKGKLPSGAKGACSECGKGVPSAALRSAVSGSASLARGCYNRALRAGGAQGSLTVSVRIGSHGGVCGASIVSDSLRNPGISQCVLSKFRARSYPKPEKGCVVVNVPLAFKMK